MTTPDARWRCPEGCEPPDDAPFFYPASAFEAVLSAERGVLVYADGSISSRYEDGTVGVPDEVQRYLAELEEPPRCISCLEEAREVLETEKDTPEMGARVLAAGLCFLRERFPDCHVVERWEGRPLPRDVVIAQVAYEHGQWWLLVNAPGNLLTYSVVDAECDSAIDGFDFERV